MSQQDLHLFNPFCFCFYSYKMFHLLEDYFPIQEHQAVALVQSLCNNAIAGFLSVSVLSASCSSIHDHTDSHCFLKLLQGQLKETLFKWPDSKTHGDMVQKSQRILQENQCAYINGKIVCSKVLKDHF